MSESKAASALVASLHEILALSVSEAKLLIEHGVTSVLDVRHLSRSDLEEMGATVGLRNRILFAQTSSFEKEKKPKTPKKEKQMRKVVPEKVASAPTFEVAPATFPPFAGNSR